MESKDLLISIIVPMYNSETYITQTINSFLQQTYNNIEIIIVDDGSTDSSKIVVKKMSETHPEIKYIYQNNSGAPAARNKGMENSKGAYIIFFDSDDIMNPDAISSLVKGSGNGKYDLVIGNFSTINEENLILSERSSKICKVLQASNKPEITFNDLLKLSADLPPVPANKMYKKSFIEKNNLCYSSLKIGQDLNFYLKSLACYPTLNIIEPIVFKYRIHNNSISSTHNDSILDIINVFKIIDNNNYTFFNNNQDIYKTIKFKNYLLQILKIPKIKKIELRDKVYTAIIAELKAIKFSELDYEILGKYPNLKKITAKIICNFKKIYISEYIHKIASRS